MDKLPITIPLALQQSLLLVTTALALAGVGSTPLVAQCDSTFQAISDADYGWGSLDEEGNPDTLDIESLALAGPEYTFFTASDSSKIRFQIGEFMLNRRKMFLAHWCLGRTINWSDSLNSPIHEWTPQQLRERTMTRDVVVNPGDTIQFYRAVWWIDRLHNAVVAYRYINPDAVSYSAVLEYGNGQRIALIDSMHFAATTHNRRPCISSWYPMLSRVRAIVPATVDSGSVVRVRINMYHHGTPATPFVRNDIYDAMESAMHLTDPTWRAWNDSVLAAIDCAQHFACDISATSSSSPSRITISASSPTALTNVQIVRTSGATVWSSAVPMTNNPLDVHVEPGLYIVVATSNGVTQCTRKIVVP
jgi:hypothetical protein